MYSYIDTSLRYLRRSLSVKSYKDENVMQRVSEKICLKQPCLVYPSRNKGLSRPDISIRWASGFTHLATGKSCVGRWRNSGSGALYASAAWQALVPTGVLTDSMDRYVTAQKGGNVTTLLVVCGQARERTVTRILDTDRANGVSCRFDCALGCIQARKSAWKCCNFA